MSIARNAADGSDFYACPACKRALKAEERSLNCPACQRAYPIVAGLPNFILADMSLSNTPLLRRARYMDWLARIYETGLWYTPLLKIYGGRSAPTFKELIRIVLGTLPATGGTILDAACGPGTWGRRIASQVKEIYGIDISWGMLRRGLGYAAQDRIANIHFARGQVEALPFSAARFDAAFCGGALHHLSGYRRCLAGDRPHLEMRRAPGGGDLYGQ